MGPLGTIPTTATIALNFTRERAPTVTDDAANGYVTGGFWTDTTTQKVYICASAVAGNADWQEVVQPAPVDSSKLAWAPPTLGAGGVTVVPFTLTDATRNSSVLGSGAGRDLLITQTQALTGGMAQMTGWRHIVWIGGELNIASGTNVTCVIPRGCTGTVHLEGIYIHGSGVGDAFVNRQIGPYITQIENCRFEVNSQAGFHADCFQCQGVELDAVRWDKCTFYTNYQGIFLRNAYATLPGAYVHNVDIRRTNFRGPGSNRFWQSWEDPAHIGQGAYNDGTAQAIAPVSLQDVWIAGDGDSRPDIGRRLFPASTFEDGFGGGTASMRRGCFVDSDSTSNYVRFSTGSETVPAGGPKSGQATLDCQITGIIRDGVPPDGDFCPVGVAGLGYSTPGYQ